MLINTGASLELTDQWGRTAFYCAALTGSRDIIELLSEQGARTDVRHMDGTSVMLVAAMNGHLETLDFILNQLDRNKTSIDEYEQALLVAGQEKHFDCYLRLVEVVDDEEGCCSLIFIWSLPYSIVDGNYWYAVCSCCGRQIAYVSGGLLATSVTGYSIYYLVSRLFQGSGTELQTLDSQGKPKNKKDKRRSKNRISIFDEEKRPVVDDSLGGGSTQSFSITDAPSQETEGETTQENNVEGEGSQENHVDDEKNEVVETQVVSAPGQPSAADRLRTLIQRFINGEINRDELLSELRRVAQASADMRQISLSKREKEKWKERCDEKGVSVSDIPDSFVHLRRWRRGK